MRKARGEITKISSLFEKYKKTLKAPQGVVISEFCTLVEELVQVPLSKDRVSYTVHSGIISVRAQGPLKSEIIVRKKEILTHLKGRLGEHAPKDII
jgi:hypothetical protein